MKNFTLIGNILNGPISALRLLQPPKVLGVTYSYNAFTNTSGVTCGTGNVLGVTAAGTWIDPSNYAYQLTPAAQRST